MNKNNSTNIDATSFPNIEEETIHELEDVRNELENSCEIEDNYIYGISYEILLRLLDACYEADSDIIHEDDSFGDYGISLELDILPFLEEYPDNTMLYGRIGRDSNGNIDWLDLRGACYKGDVTKKVLIDFFTAFRFSEDVTIGDDCLDADF